MLKAVAAVSFAAVLASCQSTPREEKPFNICSDGLKLLGNPNISDWQKLTIYESMKNAGCMDKR